MRIYSIIANGRRHYRLATHDARGVLVSFLPTRLAHRMLRNLAA